jgi:hypothetical protein
MSATEAAGAKREYRCKCGGLLFVSSVPSGQVSGVYCRKCGIRQAVTFGGHQPAERAMDDVDGRHAAPSKGRKYLLDPHQ